MTLCVTPNAALDRTLIVPGLQLGETYHPNCTLVSAGGKGVNVARAIRLLGGDACCAGLLGGHSGRLVAELAEREGLRCRWTWTKHETRVCTILVDPDRGQATGIYEVGDTISQNDWTRLHEDVIRESANVSDVCLSGILPTGIPNSSFANLIVDLQTIGPRVWVDTRGAALQSALAAKPFAIKVNGVEAGELLDTAIQNVGEAIGAAEQMRQAGVGLVALTLGGAGAVLVTADERWCAEPPQIKMLGAVGSGDAFLAALVSAFANGLMMGDCLRRAVAAGTANALSVGGGSFTLDEFGSVLKQVAARRW